jgi:hypothetical protein
MNTDFPEDIFKPRETKLSIYKHRITVGSDISKTKSVVFCGICRDVEKTIELNLYRINRIGNMFASYDIVIYENDSIDKTKNILASFASGQKNVFILSDQRDDQDYKENIINGSDPWHYERCKVLSSCRNKYLDYIQSSEKVYDYIFVLDLDILGGWSYEGISHGIFSLENNNNVACVSSYGILTEPTNQLCLEDLDPFRYLMYDSLAYRPKEISRGVHIYRLPLFNKIQFSRAEDPVFVNSNFGGMAIYKFNSLVNKRYSAKLWEEGCVDPDHVCLNRQIISEGSNIMLDPSMVCSYSKHKYCKDL